MYQSMVREHLIFQSLPGALEIIVEELHRESDKITKIKRIIKKI